MNQTVIIRGNAYDWTPDDGLEASAVMEVQGWIATLARKYIDRAKKLGLDYDDLQQAGTVGALKAAKTYKPDGGSAFVTWSTMAIKREMGKLCSGKLALSLDDAEQEMPSGDSTDDTQGVEVSQILSKLEVKDRQLLVKRFGLKTGKEETLRGLAKQAGVSHIAIATRITRALYRARLASRGSK